MRSAILFSDAITHAHDTIETTMSSGAFAKCGSRLMTPPIVRLSHLVFQILHKCKIVNVVF